MNDSPPAGMVLYVEDEQFDRVFMRLAFERVGLGERLRMVNNGQQAVDYLSGKGDFANREQHPLPSLILLDLNMPGISGFEVLQWARTQTSYQSLPIVVFSSSARPEDRDKAVRLGANDFLQKPSSGMKFVEVVQQLREKWPG